MLRRLLTRTRRAQGMGRLTPLTPSSPSPERARRVHAQGMSLPLRRHTFAGEEDLFEDDEEAFDPVRASSTARGSWDSCTTAGDVRADSDLSSHSTKPGTDMVLQDVAASSPTASSPAAISPKLER